MTFREANKNNDKAVIRHCLSCTELVKRLSNYYSSDTIEEITMSAKNVKSWYDGDIIVLYFKDDETYSVVARPDQFMSLV